MPIPNALPLISRHEGIKKIVLCLHFKVKSLLEVLLLKLKELQFHQQHIQQQSEAAIAHVNFSRRVTTWYHQTPHMHPLLLLDPD